MTFLPFLTEFFDYDQISTQQTLNNVTYGDLSLPKWDEKTNSSDATF